MTEGERLASLALVADGVGGTAQGETASRVALQAAAKYVASTVRSSARPLPGC